MDITKYKPLKELAIIKQGYSYRTFLENNPAGNVSIILPKDIDEKGNISTDNLLKINISIIKEGTLLKKGDIIISNKGRFTAGVIKNDDIALIAGGNFFIIRLTAKINPHYLEFYLNSFAGQKQISKLQGITTTKILTKSFCQDLQIPIISEEKQETFGAIYLLNKKADFLNQKIRKLKNIMLNNLLGGE
jgi:restriction endonuclease S subunit